VWFHRADCLPPMVMALLLHIRKFRGDSNTKSNHPRSPKLGCHQSLDNKSRPNTCRKCPTWLCAGRFVPQNRHFKSKSRNNMKSSDVIEFRMVVLLPVITGPAAFCASLSSRLLCVKSIRVQYLSEDLQCSPYSMCRMVPLT
jgi:hypothetical protein